MAAPGPGELDARLEEMIAANGPGVAVLVAQNGRVLFERGYGLADLQDRRHVNPKTIFHIGSISKQFTAAAILKLQEQGRLSVSDTISKFLPGYPRGDEIRIGHLLSHTSGIHNYTERADFIENITKPISMGALINLFRNEPLDFDPGTQWHYSNSNYVLLALIIEKISGESYAHFLQHNFFRPLGMKHTGVYVVNRRGRNEAAGYQYLDGRFIPAVPWDMSRAIGVGAIYSTTHDLFRWNEALFNGRVLSRASLASALTPVEPDGDQVHFDGGYGFGFFISKLRQSREIWHGGSLHGFSSYLMRLPRENITVVVLSNSLPARPGVDTGRLAHETAEMYLGDELGVAEVAKANPDIPAKALGAIAGRYDYGPGIMTVSVEAGHVYTQVAGQARNEIFPKSETEFFWNSSNGQLKFVKSAEGKVIRAIQYRDGYRLNAIRLAALDASAINAVVGSYDGSREGKGSLTIARDGDRMFAHWTGQIGYEIFPKSATEFYAKSTNTRVKFVKNDAGKVIEAIGEQDGATWVAPKIE